MLITEFENKYIESKDNHLIVFGSLDVDRFSLLEVPVAKNTKDGLFISYGSESVVVVGASVRSSDILCCEIADDGIPSRVYKVSLNE